MISPSLCSSQGACARNSANFPQLFAVSGPVGFTGIMVICPVFSCVRGIYPCPVSPPCLYVMPFAYPPPKGWCHASTTDVRVGWLSVPTMLACCGVLCDGVGLRCWSAGCSSSSRWCKLTRFQCWPCDMGMGGTLCSIPCTGLRTVQACPYPFPRGSFCACQGESPAGYFPAASAGAWVCCCDLCAVAWVVRPERGGGLGESQMWMMAASASLLFFQRTAVVSLCLLRVCLSVRIRIRVFSRLLAESFWRSVVLLYLVRLLG